MNSEYNITISEVVSNAISDEDIMGKLSSMLGGVNHRIILQLEEKTNQYESLQKDYGELNLKYKEQRETIADMATDNHRMSVKIKYLEAALNQYHNCRSDTETGKFVPKNKFIYDVSLFNTDSRDVLEQMFAKWIELANEHDFDGNYYLTCATDVIPVFLVHTSSLMTDKQMFYMGKQNEFVNCWNQNIVPNINDPQRAIELTLNEASFNAQKSNVFKGCPSPLNWREKTLCKKVRKTARDIFKRALNIKAFIMQFAF